MAVGLQALGGCAVGWVAASGAVAMARDFALGLVAVAAHTNDAFAEAFIANSRFFQIAQAVLRHVQWLNLVWLLAPALWLWQRRKNQRHQLRPAD